ncbi:MAG: hypothetical protein K2L37_02810, partial [Lactobacillus sp.]|nr:hypothetical protein [Lactobacillus sp.]
MQETTNIEELLAELSSNPRDNWLEWEIRPQESPYPQLVNMHQCSVDVSSDSFVYDGTERCPEIQVVYGGKALVRNKEYEVRYYNNVDAGTAEVKIAGLRQYVDCVSQAFVINKAGMAGAKVIATPVVYDGTPKIPKLSVSCNGRILELNKDYTLSCENNIESGTGFAVLTGKGNYEGAAETAFEIQKADIAKAGVSLEQRSYIYDGKAKTPSVAVKLGEKTLVLNTDYTVAYSNNTKAGTATVTVTGKSNYTGSKKVSFKIVGENPKITCKKTVYKVAYGTKPFKINAASKSKMA